MAADGIALTPGPNAKNSDYRVPVEVRLYDDATEQAAVQEAIDAIAEAIADLVPHDANVDGVKSLAVIARAGEQIRRLQAQYSGVMPSGDHRIVWDSPLTRDFLKTVHHLSHGETVRAVRAYEQLLTHAGGHATTADMRLAVMRQASISAADSTAYRVLLLADLKCISEEVNGRVLRISDCASCGDIGLLMLKPGHREAIRRDCAGFADPAKALQDRLLPELFAAREERTWLTHPKHPKVRTFFSTAHAVKGETHDAVLFYTRHRVLACGCPQSAGTWKAVLQHSILACETKRIAYVACSRAAQKLTVLAPAGSLAAWQALAHSPMQLPFV